LNVPGRSHLLIVGFVDAKEALTLKLGHIRKVLEMFIAMVRLGFSGFRAAAGGEMTRPQKFRDTDPSIL
jgi:hypothetical protein